MAKQRIMKILSWYLIISMVFQMLPINLLIAYADSGSETLQTVSETTGEGESGSPNDADSEGDEAASNNPDKTSDGSGSADRTDPAEDDWNDPVASGNLGGAPSVYTVNFHNDEEISDQLIEPGNPLSIPEAGPAPEGKFLAGWNTAADGTGNWVDDGYIVDDDLDLFPIYFPIEVNFTYVAGDHGTVDPSDEKVDLLSDRDAKPAGALAVADKDAVFANWTDEDGNIVSDKELFVPEISADTVDCTYTANFIYMPASLGNIKAESDNVVIYISYDERVFPEGAAPVVRDVSGDIAKSMGEAALGKDYVIADGIAFDISFLVPVNGRFIEVQPREGTNVNVTITMKHELSGGDLFLLHQEHDGSVSKVASKSAEAPVQKRSMAKSGSPESDGGKSGGTASFSFTADSFSIYAIVGGDDKIITVNFYDGEGNLITSEYVRKNPNDGKIEDLYSPGIDLEYGEDFYGWSADPNAATGSNISSINEEFKAGWESYDSEVPVNYYAVVKKVYIVTFNTYNDEGTLVVLDTKTITCEPEGQTINIPGDLGSHLGSQFLGWLGEDGVTYLAGTSFTVDKHFRFYLKEAGRYWLVFDSNAGGPGSGATYIPPQLIYGEGVVTEKPKDPTRTGYTFLGWNTEANGSGDWWNKKDDPDINRFGTAITGDVKLYAQWQGDYTKYYVVYWKQSSADAADLPDDQKTYNYAGGREVTNARTGDIVYLEESDKNKGYEHYTYNDSRSDNEGTAVAAEGTTVLNVYYDLEAYTLTFEIETNQWHYYETTSNEGDQFGYYNNRYVQIYYSNGTWYRTRSLSWGGYTDSNPYYGIR